MEASDMLDVVHYFLEEDFRYSTESESTYKDLFRENLFKEFYGITYHFAQKQDDYGVDQIDESIQQEELSVEPTEERITPFNPRATKVKEYFEPTQISDGDADSPFGNILDPPIG
jgi:hypothetical protein